MKSPAHFPRKLILLFVFMSLFLLVGTSTTYAAPANASTDQQVQGYYYTIQWGDTLSQIAVRSGTTMQAIMMANPQIVNPNLLYAGTVIFIPTGTSGGGSGTPGGGGTPASCRYYHTVLPGQYLLQIGNQAIPDPVRIFWQSQPHLCRTGTVHSVIEFTVFTEA